MEACVRPGSSGAPATGDYDADSDEVMAAAMNITHVYSDTHANTRHPEDNRNPDSVFTFKFEKDTSPRGARYKQRSVGCAGGSIWPTSQPSTNLL